MAIDPTGIATSLAQGPDPAAVAGKAKDTREAAQQFEGFLVEMMVQQMRKTIPEGIFQSTGIEMFSGMFDQAVAKEIAASGGFGLAESMAQQMDGTPGSLQAAMEPGVGSSRSSAMGPFSKGAQPVEGGVIASGYGRRRDPFHGETRFHKAIDIGAPMGAPIQNLAAGTVTMARANGGYGNVVMVDHGDGWKSLYAHCEELNVEEGQRVEAGELLGTVGSTGRSTGPHVHLEIRYQGNRVDPAEVLGW
jgi:murein DD-endopeptidase MepM/ murein hydrolase activator NlpD